MGCCFAFPIQGLDLRVEHTHCFSTHGEGGHYHEDVSPETVVYEGYFTPAERLFRIDRPSQTHGVGRDWYIGSGYFWIFDNDFFGLKTKPEKRRCPDRGLP
jgi:hypothetical protein